MGREDLPNGFTAFPQAQNDPDFVSAGEASRRAREAALFALQDAVDSEQDLVEQASGQYVANAERILFDPASPWQRQAEAKRESDNAAIVREQDFDPRDLRWAWVETDLGAIRHNISETRRFLNPRCRLLAVVKADAYGHGAVQVAQTALAAGADRLAVATVPEAMQLRQAGINAPILMLAQPPITSVPLLVEYDITPSLYDAEFAVAYGEAADRHGKKAPFHLVINTGMNRIGVSHDQAVDFMHQISFHRALEVEGVFTHFATADAGESLEFKRQQRRFEDAIVDLRTAGFNTGIVHAANSAAIYRYPEVHYDMVRLGIAMYGLHPCNETRGFVDLHPAMSVRARITDTHVVPMSEGVGYGLKYRSPGSVKICTVPIGYADGLHYGLASKIDFIMEGRYYHQVGNICMDQCMFEVNMRRLASVAYHDPQPGDLVTIVGRQGAAEITMDELAEKMGSIHYELAIGFSQRLPRIFT